MVKKDPSAYQKRGPKPGQLNVSRNRGLTLAIRDALPPEVITEMFLVALSGRQPKLVKDARAAHGYRVDDTTGVLLTVEQQQRYFAMFLDRGYGTPAQHVLLEANVQSRLAVLSATINPATLQAAVDAGEVDPIKLRDALRMALAPATKGSSPPGEVVESPVLDAEFEDLGAQSSSSPSPSSELPPSAMDANAERSDASGDVLEDEDDDLEDDDLED